MLPQELFTAYEDEPKAIQLLKKSFPDQTALENFFYDDHNPFPNQLVEQTAILGLFWKSWLAQRHSSTRDDFFNGKNKALPLELFEDFLKKLGIPLHIYSSTTHRYIRGNDIHNPVNPRLK